MASIRLPAPVRVPILDVDVTPLSAEDTAELIMEYVRQGAGIVIGNLNLHGVYIFHTDSEFRDFCEWSDVILVDGAPIAWAARVPTALRVGSTDWLDALMPIAGDLRILAVGGTTSVSSGAERYFHHRFPAVQWVGVDGYSSHEVSQELRELIGRAQLVLVGMGMPFQEKWLLRNRELLSGKVVANVGGCFDYYAGAQHLAPRWMGRIGIEWLYRLVRDPRRLADRYLIEPFKLVGVLIKQRLARLT